PITWGGLSDSARVAMQWAAAAAGQGQVGTGALVVGMLRSHDGYSEPEELIRHFGRDREALLDAIGATATGVSMNPRPETLADLDDIPPLSEQAQAAFAATVELSERFDPYQDGMLHLPELFGGILQTHPNDATRAL